MLEVILKTALLISGLSAVCAGIFMIYHPAGIIAAGLSVVGLTVLLF